MTSKILVLATHNENKVTELQQILEVHYSDRNQIQVVSSADYNIEAPVEDGVSFEDNAIIKAKAVAKKTGKIALADDSGLCVDILGGSPGIFSSRWSGRFGDKADDKDKANCQLLLDQIKDVPDEHRGAEFVCAVAVAYPDGKTYTARGQMKGKIIHSPQGTNGFGYDPIFISDDIEQDKTRPITNAQLSSEEKNKISHRTQALEKIIPFVKEAFSSSLYKD